MYMNTKTIKMDEFRALYFCLCSNKNRGDIQIYGHLFLVWPCVLCFHAMGHIIQSCVHENSSATVLCTSYSPWCIQQLWLVSWFKQQCFWVIKLNSTVFNCQVHKNNIITVIYKWFLFLQIYSILLFNIICQNVPLIQWKQSWRRLSHNLRY
jgi:hypothetical protein